MTRETFLDIIIMCQCRILLVVLYRECGFQYRIFADRFSSRFSEYVFQYARMAETNSPLFGVMGFHRHLQHFILQMEMAVTSGLKLPPSKRGVPNDVSRVTDRLADFRAPPGWHLSDPEICSLLDEQSCADKGRMGQAVWWWVVYLECDSLGVADILKNPDNFFSHPVKHFGKGDVWGGGKFLVVLLLCCECVVTGVDGVAADLETREREDDGEDPSETVVEVWLMIVIAMATWNCECAGC